MKHEVRIASPCHANWDKMPGDARVRHCGECDLDVFNFSEMSEREIERLVEERQGRLCARYYQRPDGTMLTKNCPTAFRASLLRATRVTSAALATIISFVPGLSRAPAVAAATPARGRAGLTLLQIQPAPTGVTIQVVDATGAVIARTAVRVINEATGEISSGLTNSDGVYRLNQTAAGKYRIEIAANGFTSQKLEHVALPAAAPIRVQMEVAQLMGAVVVMNTPPIKAESPVVVRTLVPPHSLEDSKPVEPENLMQTPTGAASIALEVTGTDGNAAANALVTLTNEHDAFVVQARTNEKGQLRFAGLEPGEYTVIITGAEGAQFEQAHVTLPLATTLAAHLALP
jgi:hypothetical protein